jgi:hypothetical protein
MSRSARPAFFSAAITRLIWAALACMAAAAVGASVVTPRVMVAMSGATLVSPYADRFRVVARNIDSAAGGAAWARAAGATTAAAVSTVRPTAAARVRVFIA